MKNTIYLLILLISGGFSGVIAQTPFKCGTPHYTEEDFRDNPSLRKSVEELEKFTQEFTENYQTLKQQQAPPFIIPIVFHIIHNYTSNFISDAQVHDAVRILNEDFRMTNPDISQVVTAFQPIAADSEIEFRLARIDPNGNCTNGITRTFSNLTLAGDNNVKSLIMWDQAKYLNVWVVQNISSPGVAAFATPPSNSSISVDGIVNMNAYLGSIGTGSVFGSRTLTHEVGHYFNLKHTWGSTNAPGLSTNCNDDDFVSDTPNTIGHTSCNLTAISCNSLDNVQNYMEYTFCSKMFTEGQKVRMQAALFASTANRNNLWQDSNLVATGTDDNFAGAPCVPIADFKTNEKYICEGSSVSFTDYSWNGDSLTYNWSFPGGTPATSSDANPVITYNTAGTYSVTLTVSNITGSDSRTEFNVINVRKIAASYFAPVSEDFENISAIPNGPWLVDNEGGTTWELTNAAAFNGSTSVRIYNFSGNVVGKTDVLITPSYDLTYVSNATLNFKMSFAVRSSSSTDQLRVLASTTCGQFWTQRFTKSGPALSTWGLVTNDFVPSTANQWREETVNISSGLFSGQPNVSFKFEYTQDTGNNIYIDDINIDGVTSAEGNIESANMQMYPNPATITTRVEFSLLKDDYVIVKLLDILGREIKIIAEGRLPAGEHYTEITDLETAGVYFVKLIIGENEVVNKLVMR